MTTTPPEHPQGEDWLDQELAAMRDDVLPSDAFLARLTQDALAAQPVPGITTATPVPFWRQLLDALGGWGGCGGLVAATCVGLAVGLGGVDLVDSTYDSVMGLGTPGEDNLGSGVSGFGWDFDEGET